VHDSRQIDLSEKVELVKRKTRPWKSIIALLLAIAAGVIADNARSAYKPGSSRPFFSGKLANHGIAAGGVVLFLVFGFSATYGLAGKAKELLEPKVGTQHSAVFRYAILLIGAFTTLVITLDLVGGPVGQLVLGGALTSVFVGIAAQQSLSNVFAGLVLMFARPFRVGDAIRLRAGALGGTLEGVVTDIGITYVRLVSDGTVMSIPNSQVLNAVVGPIPPEPDAQLSPLAVAGTGSGTPGGPEQPHPAGPA
jgi:small-conductance mechanosensitive channel